MKVLGAIGTYGLYVTASVLAALATLQMAGLLVWS